MRLAIIIPTIPGREKSLERAVGSYEKTAEIPYGIQVVRDSRSSGEGWIQGVAEWVEWHGKPDYIHLTNDDCEVTDPLWWKAPVEVCGEGFIPAPIVRNPDGSLQSAGGDLGSSSGDLLTEMREDGAEVGFTTIPFLSWSQWEQIGMMPVHYASDVWVSHKGRQLGIPTILCHGYKVIHHTEQIGRNQGRSGHDRQVVMDALG